MPGNARTEGILSHETQVEGNPGRQCDAVLHEVWFREFLSQKQNFFGSLKRSEMNTAKNNVWKGYKDCDRPLYSDPTVTEFLPGHAPAIRVHNTFRQSVIILQSVKNSSNATKENFKQKRYAQ